MRRVYIVLSTAGVGGAEKRFTDNWYSLVDKGMDIHLVMDRQTYQGLCEQTEYAQKLAPSNYLHVRDLGAGHFRLYCRAVHEFFSTQPKNSIVHFPLAYVPGIKLIYGHRLVMSWVNSAMPPFKKSQWRNGLGAWLGFMAADYIDILNPNNLNKIRNFPRMASKCGLTAGGTQVDAKQYYPLKKSLSFVFLGRLEPEKQSLRFLKVLPAVHQSLKAQGYHDYRFFICGDGKEASVIKALLETTEFNDVPVEYGYSSRPNEILGHASIYFSLQKTSNYPSKALAEAMACGALPILTNVGESSLMVDGLDYFNFVPKDFTAQDLLQPLSSFLALSEIEKNNIVKNISAYAERRFRMGKQAEYFAEIYRLLDQEKYEFSKELRAPSL
ncbi:MAG: glycosyltransferase [Pseudomonadota bacterium]